jgi:hypothetical protein
MGKDSNAEAAAMTDLQSAARELLGFLTGPELAESDLFPYGVTHVAISVKVGEAELQLEVSGPDHPHEHEHDHDDEDDWLIDRGDAISDLDDDL